MSSFSKEIIKCPNCQQEGGFTVWQSVNVDLDPEMKEKVMDGSIFQWTCPNCGKQYTVPYPLLYHDMTNNFMVQYHPDQPVVLFVEYIKVQENRLDYKVIDKLEETYRNKNARENILFNGMTSDGDLEFKVYIMPNEYWEETDRKYIIPIIEYKALRPQED